MSKFAFNEAVEAELKDLHRGLHQALDELETRKNYREAGVILKQMDARFVELINFAKVSKP
ncbi:hypothetical protein [Neoaquamicrobium sediminum]|uniref:hypothetical protein n=1 Tax=Neoaquamicrobium sediminum TaxID=1849104 RepID=UPI0036183C75